MASFNLKMQVFRNKVEEKFLRFYMWPYWISYQNKRFNESYLPAYKKSLCRKNSIQCLMELVYLADGEKNPFGKKTKKQIVSIVEDWLKYFEAQNLIALVIACNTASIAVESDLRFLEDKYEIPIITMVAGTRHLLNKNEAKINGKNIVLFGTKFTVHSQIYRNIIKKLSQKNIFLLDGTQTERLVARGLFKKREEEKVATQEIGEFIHKNIDYFFLGCTCFEFVKNKIKKIYPGKIKFLNPSKEISNITKKRLKVKKNKKMRLRNVKIYTTGELEEWKNNINILAKKVFHAYLPTKKLEIR